MTMYGRNERILKIPFEYLLEERDKSWKVVIAGMTKYIPKSKAEIEENETGTGGTFFMGEWIANQKGVERYEIK